MTPEVQARIIAIRPDLFALHWPAFDCGDGWAGILERLVASIAALDDLPPGFSIVQVKEKFGGLRFYVSCENDEIERLISDAERESFRTCEKCGAPGRLRDDRAWYTTLCEAHA